MSFLRANLSAVFFQSPTFLYKRFFFFHLFLCSDDEKTKTKKRKLMKSYKSKQRFQQMDVVQKQKADAWKNFSAKGTITLTTT